MKTLVVYANNSLFKYPNVYDDFLYEIDRCGILKIFKLSRDNQYEENEKASFKNWDYYLIEEE